MSDETLGGFGVLTGRIGPFEERLGDGLGTGIIEELEEISARLVPVGVGGIPMGRLWLKEELLLLL